MQSMAGPANGEAIEPDHSRSVNGRLQTRKSKATAVKGRRRWNPISIISRITIWYCIVTIFLRCPATLNQTTDQSPMLCKKYFHAREIATPYIEPYYKAYVASYVEAARPYYHTLDTYVLAPIAELGTRFAGPRYAQLKTLGQAQWDHNVHPRIMKTQKAIYLSYNTNCAPYVTRMDSVTAPYVTIAKDSAFQTYYEHILPVYTNIKPYALKAYGSGTYFALNTALPYAQWAWNTGSVFVDRKLMPKIRILYGENVEPQLLRIRERLGRYRDGEKVKATIKEYNSSSSAEAQNEFTSNASLSTSTQASISESQMSPSTETEALSEASAKTTLEQTLTKAQEIVARDLKSWQEKYTQAADESSNELRARIKDITDRLISNQAEKVGPSLIIELEEAVKSYFKSLKSNIISIIGSGKASNVLENDLNSAVRKAGIAIKDRAQAVRTWKQKYDQETNELISQSATDTLRILDSIGELCLQEVGMRWAWTDGITQKHWTKYHALTPKINEWRHEVELVAIHHPNLAKARTASQDIENQAMDIAQEAAKELGRIKEAGRWKISAQDTSDDWTIKYLPPAAAKASQEIMDKVSQASEAVVGSPSQGTLEKLTSAASGSVEDMLSSGSSFADAAMESLSSLAFSASVPVLGDPQSSFEIAISPQTEDPSSGAIVGSSQGTIASISSAASALTQSSIHEVSSSVVGTQNLVESDVSLPSEKASSASVGASSAVKENDPGGISNQVLNNAQHIVDHSVMSPLLSAGSSTPLREGSSTTSLTSSSATKSSISTSSTASSVSSAVSKKVWGGVEAQVVEARQIIFDDITIDDDETYSAQIQSMASRAGDRFAQITQAVSEALLKPTSTQGVGESVTSLAADQYSRALAAASSALLGAEQDFTDSAVSVVSSKYSAAVASASIAIYGTPGPLTSHASEAYNNAMSMASERYSSAVAAVSAKISGTPKSVHSEMLNSVEQAYSDSLKAANSQLNVAVSVASAAVYGTPLSPQQSMYSAASSMLYGTPQGAIESIQSVAASRLSEGLSSASSYYQDVKRSIAATPTPEPISIRLLQQAQAQYYVGIGLAHERYSEFISAASSAIISSQTPSHYDLYSKANDKLVGTSTPAYQSALDAASSQYLKASAVAVSNLDALLASISNAGTSTSGLKASASSLYSIAVAEASKSYDSASSGVSSAVYGTETPWTESLASAASLNWDSLVMTASSQIYGAPTPTFLMMTDQIKNYASVAASQANGYASQATESAIIQYSAVQSLIGELVYGHEPDFTESVYSRLHSAYYTDASAAAASASSYASQAYGSASSIVASAFTPPPAIENILNAASLAMNDAVDAASIKIYGSHKGAYEQATSSAASVYSSVQSEASKKFYGTDVGYAKAAGTSIADAASAAQKAIEEAIYGTSTGTVESVTGALRENAAAATEALGSADGDGYMRVSKAIYGEEEKGAVTSALARLNSAVDNAKKNLQELGDMAGDGTGEAYSRVSEQVESLASGVSSAVEGVASSVTRNKDEL